MNKRSAEIMQLFRQKDFWTVSELAERLSVSQMTIRRNLAVLEERRLVRRQHGGATALHMLGSEPDYSSRANDSVPEKLEIAETASKLVRDGSVIAVDSGSTCLSLVSLLLDRDLTIVTCSLHVMEACMASSTVKVIVPSGILRNGEGSIYGADCVSYLSTLHVDQFFMGVGGIEAKAGLTDYSIEDAAVKRTILSNSSETIVLADSSKFNRITFARVCSFEDIDVLVTEAVPSGSLSDLFIRSGVRVLSAENRRENEQGMA